MVLVRIRAWVETHRNGTRAYLPANIIYIRDGVSEGQYSKVKNEEVTAIRKAFTIIAQEFDTPTSEVKITAIIAVKRHHTRFFPIKKSDMQGKVANYTPGTLVEDVVVSPYFTDFYLQSHNTQTLTCRYL